MAAETKIKIAQIPPYDGEYELDLEDAFTTREWRWLKQIGGYGPLAIEAALNNGDPDLVVALAVIAMHRADRIGRDDVLAVSDKLMDAPFDGAHISVIGGEDDDARPPAETNKPDK